MVETPSTRTILSLAVAGLAIWTSGAPARSTEEASTSARSEAVPVSPGGPEGFTAMALEVDSGTADSDGNGVLEPGE